MAGQPYNPHLKDVAGMKLHRDLGGTQKTAWRLAHRIRETWSDNPAMFTGAVETDETHTGGKRRNMPKAARKELIGRGGDGESAVAGIEERGTGRVQAAKARTDNSRTSQAVCQGAWPVRCDALLDEAAGPSRNARVYAWERQPQGLGACPRTRRTRTILQRGYQGIFHQLSEKRLELCS